MTVERLRNLALRNLLKQIAEQIAANQEDMLPPELQGKPYIMPLKLPFEKLIKWDPDLDMDELECILANLISLGYVRGYISHERALLVLSKESAFPESAFNE